MAKRGPYTAGGRALPALQGRTFASYYAYQQARAQAMGYKGYAQQRVVEGRLSSDKTFQTFQRKALFEGRSARWARERYTERSRQLGRRLTTTDSRQLQVDTGLADNFAEDTWYH